MRVAVVGATGLIGGRLVERLTELGMFPVPVSRSGGLVRGVPCVTWDAASGPPPEAMLDGTDAIVNLAGVSIGEGRWTEARKRAILDSRLATTGALVQAIADGGPRVLVNASAVGVYGTGERECDESTPPGDDFLARTCVQWEEAARAASTHGARVVLLRSGIVLAARGGALAKQLPLFRLGLGGPLGGGRQWQSWIHLDDEVDLIVHALRRTDLVGPLNLTAPTPVRQREFAATLGRVLGRPAVLPTPGIALRLALGEMSTLALDGQRVVPRRAQDTGFAFRFTDLEPALRDLLG
ncbi:MAG: TIGR01777 family oxidoreductase [Thermoleophilia bacterium]